MALETISVTVDAIEYEFDVASVNANKSVRLDTTHGSLSTPLVLTHDNQPGSALKPDRRLIRVDLSKVDPETGESATVSAHTVLTVPRHPAITLDDAALCYALLRTYLSETVAESIIKGQLQ